MLTTIFTTLATLLSATGWLIIIGVGVGANNYLSSPCKAAHLAARDMTIYVHLANMGLWVGYGVLLLHLARANSWPYMVQPYEMRFPLERATVNLLIQVLQVGVLYTCLDRARLDLRLPLPWLLTTLALIGTLGSAWYNTVDNTSFCCENPLATSWGFPFSWLYGIAQDPPFAPSAQWTASMYITQFSGQIQWRISGWKFVADFIFWWNVLFLACAWPVGLRLITSIAKPFRALSQRGL